jgi:hypothetical protein
LFDAPCYTAIGRSVDTVTVHWALARLPVWRAAWERHAPQLLRAVVARMHAPFKFADAQAAIFTCGEIASMSLPLMIKAHRVVAGQDATARSAADADSQEGRQFVSMAFHEILHRYVSDRIGAPADHRAPLLRKYAGEPRVVVAHLHVFALMEQVYRRLGMTAEAENMLRTAGSKDVIVGMRGPDDWIVHARSSPPKGRQPLCASWNDGSDACATSRDHGGLGALS